MEDHQAPGAGGQQQWTKELEVDARPEKGTDGHDAGVASVSEQPAVTGGAPVWAAGAWPILCASLALLRDGLPLAWFATLGHSRGPHFLHKACVLDSSLPRMLKVWMQVPSVLLQVSDSVCFFTYLPVGCGIPSTSTISAETDFFKVLTSLTIMTKWSGWNQATKKCRQQKVNRVTIEPTELDIVLPSSS